MTYVPIFWLIICIMVSPYRPGLLLACGILSYQYDDLYDTHVLGPSLFFLFAAITGITAFTQKRLITLNIYDYIIFSFGALYVMSSLYAPDFMVAINRSGRLVALCIGYYVIGRFNSSNTSFNKHYIFDFGVSVLLLSLTFGYLSVGLQEAGGGGAIRLSLGEGTAVGFSQMVDLAAAFSLFYMLSISGIDAWAKRFAMLVLFGGVGLLVLYNATRGTVVSLIFASCVYLAAAITQWRPGNRYLSRGLALIFLTIGASAFLLQFGDRSDLLGVGIDRLAMNFGLGGFQGDMSSGVRIKLFERAWDMFAQAPFLGGGVGSFVWNAKPYYPHNVFLELLAETGIITTAVFTFIFVRVGWMAFRLFRKNIPAVSIAAGIFLVTAAHQQMSFALWMSKAMFLFMGIIVTYHIQLEKPQLSSSTVKQPARLVNKLPSEAHVE